MFLFFSNHKHLYLNCTTRVLATGRRTMSCLVPGFGFLQEPEDRRETTRDRRQSCFSLPLGHGGSFNLKRPQLLWLCLIFHVNTTKMLQLQHSQSTHCDAHKLTTKQYSACCAGGSQHSLARLAVSHLAWNSLELILMTNDFLKLLLKYFSRQTGVTGNRTTARTDDVSWKRDVKRVSPKPAAL